MASRRKTRRSLGFTLMEMMIVIAIMLILIGVAIPMYNRSTSKKRRSRWMIWCRRAT